MMSTIFSPGRYSLDLPIPTNTAVRPPQTSKDSGWMSTTIGHLLTNNSQQSVNQCKTISDQSLTRTGWGNEETKHELLNSERFLGHYRLIEPIGRGGMGVVYRAEHLFLAREVAIKVVSSGPESDPKILHRFYHEARALVRLNHPSIVTCLDAGRHVNKHGLIRDYFVMELVRGQNLCEQVQRHGALGVGRASYLFTQVAAALGEVHRRGLVHRDVKPSNLMVTDDDRVKLLDFGLTRHAFQGLTDPGTVLGTIGYMAPEQLTDPHHVDARADLFALGTSLYFALTAREPFPNTGDVIANVTRRLTVIPRPIREIREDLPERLSALVDRLLLMEPSLRPSNAEAVESALKTFCD